MTSCFLSYGRKDDEAFVQRLRDDLTKRGIDVWWDRLAMRSRGVTFLSEIDDGIRSSDRLVLVAGPAALASDYVQHELDVAQEHCTIVIPVLRLGEVSDLPDALRRQHVFDLRKDDVREFEQLIAALTETPDALGPLLGDVPPRPGHLIDRDDAVQYIIDKILADVRSPVAISGGIKPTTVTGMGGIGKTVLALLVATSCPVRREFADGVLFVRLRLEITPLEIVNRMRRLLGDQPDAGDDLTGAVSALAQLLAGGRRLLILDNVWAAPQISSVVAATARSANRLVFTTRRKDVADDLDAQVYEVDLLTSRQALEYLADWLDKAPEELPDEEANDVVERCGRLPLALSICGALLSRGTAWSDLSGALRESELRFLDRDVLGYEHPGVFAAMDVGFSALASDDAEAAARYRMLAAFDTDAPVPEAIIFKLWGVNEEREARGARRHLREFAARSLLSLTSDGAALLHDIQRAYLLAAGENEASLRRELVEAYRAESDSWSSTAAPIPWLRGRLVRFMISYGGFDELYTLLTEETNDGRNAWYELRAENGEFDGYWRDLADVQDSLVWDDTDSSMPLAMRLVAMRASLLAIARNVPGALVAATVRTGVWQPARGRALVSHNPDARDRVRALIDLLNVPEIEHESLIEEIFSLLAHLPSVEYYVTLELLRENVADPWRRFVAETALDYLDSLGTQLTGAMVAALTPFLEPHDYARLQKIVARIAEPSEQAVAQAAASRLLDEDEAFDIVLDLLSRSSQLEDSVAIAEAAARPAHGPVAALVGRVLKEAIAPAIPQYFRGNFVNRLLPLASDEIVEQFEKPLDGDWLAEILGEGIWVSRECIEQCASKKSLQVPLIRYAERFNPRVYGTAFLAAILVHTDGAVRHALLLRVISRLREELEKFRSDEGWLGGVAQHFGRILSELPPDVRHRLIGAIEHIWSTQDAAQAVLGLSPGLSPAELETLVDVQLADLARTPSANEIREPLAVLASVLSKQQVEFALRVAEAARDDGFETAWLNSLLTYLHGDDRDRVHRWVLARASEHLSATDKRLNHAMKEKAIADLVRDLVSTGISATVRQQAEKVADSITDPCYRARALAPLAEAERDERAEALWLEVEACVERIDKPFDRGTVLASLAAAASGERRERFMAQALELEAEFTAEPDRQYLYMRSDILKELPVAKEVSERALALLNSASSESLAHILKELVGQTEPAALATVYDEQWRYWWLREGREGGDALAKRLAEGGFVKQALEVCGSPGSVFWDGRIDSVSPFLPLNRVRELLRESPSNSGLLERLAELGEPAVAIDKATALAPGSERFQTVARCCAHASDQQLEGPMLRVLPDLRLVDDPTPLWESLRLGAPQLARLPREGQTEACKAVLDVLGHRIRLQALPGLYLVSPLVFALMGQDGLRATFQAVDDAARWWPSYPGSSPHSS